MLSAGEHSFGILDQNRMNVFLGYPHALHHWHDVSQDVGITVAAAGPAAFELRFPTPPPFAYPPFPPLTRKQAWARFLPRLAIGRPRRPIGGWGGTMMLAGLISR